MRTSDRSLEIAELVDRMRDRDDKIVGFDLAGAETGFPPSLHAPALALARERHLNVTIHASEPPDLELIDDALVHGAHRIGHGVRLNRDTVSDPEAPGGLRLGSLARYVLDRQIHLELAPTCNVQIGAVNSVVEHPIGPFLRAGFSVGDQHRQPADERRAAIVGAGRRRRCVRAQLAGDGAARGECHRRGVRSTRGPAAGAR